MFSYQNGQLCAQNIPLSEIARRFGTPCYVYSRNAIEKQWHALDMAFSQHRHLICYAVKANSNLAVLNLLASLGSGFDVVSAGELTRVLKAGGKASKIVFSGVGKRVEEMQLALEANIKCFNIESLSELHRLNLVAANMQKLAPIALRINPDIDAQTHAYIATGLKENKFGINFETVLSVYQAAQAMENIKIKGIACHIGSQITSMAPFNKALQRLLQLTQQLQGKDILLEHIDIGGGLGIVYQQEKPPTAEQYAAGINAILGNSDYELILEPGRSIIGAAGIMLTKIEYLKETIDKRFAIVDAAMNDLLRPALYHAQHQIIPVNQPSADTAKTYDIVGPICETTDFLGKSCRLSLVEGELLAVLSVGAYGFSMASTYNSRPKICELMVTEQGVHEIRRRETIEELMAGESLLPETCFHNN